MDERVSMWVYVQAESISFSGMWSDNESSHLYTCRSDSLVVPDARDDFLFPTDSFLLSFSFPLPFFFSLVVALRSSIHALFPSSAISTAIFSRRDSEDSLQKVAISFLPEVSNIFYESFSQGNAMLGVDISMTLEWPWTSFSMFFASWLNSRIHLRSSVDFGLKILSFFHIHP